MSTRPRLESTVLASVDVGDQPAGPYIFIIEGLLGPRQAFTIDGWRVDNGWVSGVRHVNDKDVTVIAVPVNAPWAVVRRDVLIFTTVTESAKKRKVDDLAQASFEKELFPATSGEVAPPGTVPILGYAPGPGVYA